MALTHMSLSVFLVIASIYSAYSQIVHTVEVGVEGAFYNPPTISAQVNDIINFIFAGDMHTVTQSAFDDPCTPLKGGFSSGLAGRGTNGSAPAAFWNLQITDDTKPIWFFCGSNDPVSHCAAGMVGVINPPSIKRYNRFVAAAKLVSPIPIVTPSVVLSGIGAFATNAPVISATSPTSTAPISTSSTTSTTAPFTTSHTTSGSHKGAIIGGTIGALCALIILTAVIFILLRRRQDSLCSQIDPYQEKYTPRTNDDDSFRNVKSAESQPLMQQLVLLGPSASRSSIAPEEHPFAVSSREAPMRPIRPLPVIPTVYRNASPVPTSGPRTEYEGTMNVSVLAREVAAILLQSSPDEYVPRHAGPTNSVNPNSRSKSNLTMGDLPPHYRPR